MALYDTYPITLYNTLTRKKEKFKPLHKDYIGIYVCGPTVYGDAHLGHAKSYVSFDVIIRYLKQLGYHARYVQNITDVGHLMDDADEGEDKIQQQSRLEGKEPMQIVEHYKTTYFRDMDKLNILRPDIIPQASGHIIEQIQDITALIKKGYAYEVNGSVYFDVKKYNEKNDYGKLSGRKIEDLIEGGAARELQGQSEKKNAMDFALWKKAGKEHLMKWPSPWGEGYPGWHIECSVMSKKYLGDTFDIHGGGMENIFPHHESEIAQAEGITGKPFAKYWLHNNMITVNGQKMGKSLGNSICCHELFSGKHKLLKQAYSPMTVRFFILQSHYRSTLDFSNEALQAAEKGYKKLMEAYQLLGQLNPSKKSDVKDAIHSLEEKCHQVMSDDFNTPQLIATLFEGVNVINSCHDGKQSLNKDDIELLKNVFDTFVGGTIYHDTSVLGLIFEEEKSNHKLDDLMQLIIEIRDTSRKNKDFDTSDKIRDVLTKTGIQLKDEKDGSTSWNID